MRLENDDCSLQVEADLGYPGGKARIIHKESDIITAFAINKVQSCVREALDFSDKILVLACELGECVIKCVMLSQANRNCLVIASTHDIQELDVSSILATQILTWIDDEAETEVK